LAEKDKLFSPLWDLAKFQEKFKGYETEITARLEREAKEKAKEKELKDHLSESRGSLRSELGASGGPHKRHQSTIDFPIDPPSAVKNRAPPGGANVSLESRFRSTSSNRGNSVKSREGKGRAQS
jgi:hypothetical protein